MYTQSQSMLDTIRNAMLIVHHMVANSHITHSWGFHLCQSEQEPHQVRLLIITDDLGVDSLRIIRRVSSDQYNSHGVGYWWVHCTHAEWHTSTHILPSDWQLWMNL